MTDIRIYNDTTDTLLSETTLADFVEANHINGQERQRIMTAFREQGRYWYGGGAAPLIYIVPVR